MATAVEKPARNRIERIESLLKKIRAMAAAALAAVATFHAPVVAVASTNVAALVGSPVVDGVATVAGNRVALVNQTTPSQNGIWLTQAAGTAWVRPSDWASGSAHVAGEQIQVANGGTTFSRFGDTWQMTTGATVDAPASTPIFFPRFDKGTVALGGGVNTQADRWIFTGAQANANDSTAGAAAAVNIQAVTMGAGTGQANGTLTISGTGANTIRFTITNF